MRSRGGGQVSVGVLGPLQLWAGDDPVAPASRSQRRLVVRLALDVETTVSLDHLVAAVWPEQPPHDAVAALRTRVYRLRSLVGDHGPSIATDAGGYSLAVDPDELDVTRFAALVAAGRAERDPSRRLDLLTEAEDLWRGPALGDVADEPFALGEAERLEELRRTATEERFAARLELGEAASLVGDLEAYTGEHPLRERPRRQLMTALARADRRAEAVALGREFTAFLSDELGLDPPPAITDLQERILRGEDATPPDVERPAAHPTPTGVGTSDTAGSGVPTPLTPLVGRRDLVAAVGSALDTARLVTLTGPGGVGKSRIATEVARPAAVEGTRDLWWCDLAPLEPAGGQVTAAVTSALGARLGDVDDPIVAFLGSRSALIVLDNAEHVRAEAAVLASRVLARCPATTMLVTSRARLDVPGEHVRPVPPLEVEPQDATGAGTAVELLRARVHAVRPDLDLDTGAGAPAAELCRHLDGLPLAIELAASRLRSLNPHDLVRRLDDQLDVLADAGRDDPRHRRLRSVLDWSHDLLTEDERCLFARLSVFAGSFTLDAAEEVAAGPDLDRDEVLDVVSRLVDHSLVAIRPGRGPSRYRMLETVRSYSREQLRDRGEDDRVRRRHAQCQVRIAEAADRQVRGPDEAAGVHRLDREFHDLRAAHRWAVTTGDVAVALRLTAALFRFALWRLRPEIFDWAAEVAALPGAEQHAAWPTIAGMAGWAAGLRGDLATADEWADRGLAALDAPDDPRGLVPLEVVMHTAMWSGDLDRCLAAADRAADVTTDAYDLVPSYVPALALTYAGRPDDALARLESVARRADAHGNPTMRALVHYARGEALAGRDPHRAGRELQLAAELADGVDNHMVLGVTDVALIAVAIRTDDLTAALETCAAAVDRLHRSHDWTHLWVGLRSLVGLLVDLGVDRPAATLLAAVRHAPDAPPVYGEDAEALEAAERRLRDRLGHDDYEPAAAAGHTLSNERAVAVAREAMATASVP